MGLFRRGPDPRDVLIASLRAELSDHKQAQRAAEAEWAKERRDLLDRVMALANPLVLREMRRTSPGEPRTSASASGSKIHYPGGDLRVVLPPPPSRLGAPPSDETSEGDPS